MALPLLKLPLSASSNSPTLVIENGDGAPQPPNPTPQPNPACEESARTAAFAYRDGKLEWKTASFDCFNRKWYNNWIFFGHHSAENPSFRGYIRANTAILTGPGSISSQLAASLSFALERSRHMELITNLPKGLVTKGANNKFTKLLGADIEEFFSILWASILRNLSPAYEVNVFPSIGVRHSTDTDIDVENPDPYHRSAHEAFMTLTAASTGVGPVVHAAGIVKQRSVFVMDAHTPLSSLMTRAETVAGLGPAICHAFERVASTGLLMLDSKPANFVVDLDEDGKVGKVLAIDYDSTFCSYEHGTEPECLFVVNATMFLLSIHTDVAKCTKEDFEYKLPIRSLQDRLRVALGAVGDSKLCGALDRQLFQNRTYPINIDYSGKVDSIARSIIYYANYYANFDGGSQSGTHCPIDGLKFYKPIWPQLVAHVLRMQQSQVAEDETVDRNGPVRRRAAGGLHWYVV